MDPAVRLRAAVCLLGRFPALAGVDLEVAPGELVVLRGPNGAGKSTLLRALAGLVPVVDGEAVVLGHDLRVDRRSARPRIGLIGHASGLYDDLTVADNVRFWCRASGAPAVDSAAVTDALALWGVAGRLAGVVCGRLSAGQRRRVALALLTARWPDLWLLDEPRAGLDADAQVTLDDLLARARAAGTTVIVASHDDGWAESLGARVVGIVAGTTGSVPAVSAQREPAHVA